MKQINKYKEYMRIMRLKQLFAIVVSFMLAGNLLFADIARDANGKPLNDNSIQRSARGVFDLQSNTVSNLEFYTTNYGIFGLNVALGQGSGKWPRGSNNHYIFGGGIWFAAQKNRPGTNELRNYVTITYNPNSGTSWMVPGRISDGPLVDNEAAQKYRVYFSTDFFSSDGTPIIAADGPAWPIWDANPEKTLTKDRYFGYYIPEPGDRNTSRYPKGPAFISGEDIFATYKDTDLSRYEGGVAQRRAEGYPLQLQIEKMIYSWGFGDYRDIVFMAYNITNYSPDVLLNCWMAPVMDIDIATAFNLSGGAANDRVRFHEDDPSLNLAYQWTDPDRGERGQGFGYLGFTFLESPTVWKFYDTTFVKDDQGNIIGYTLNERLEELTNYVRKDSLFYATENQLGLVTFRNWSIENDPKEDSERYNFLSEGIREGDTGPGDKRFMMATGPFHLRPMDTVRVVVGLILANTSKGGDADGTPEDTEELLNKTKFARDVYNNDFQAPKPPDRAVFQIKEGLNNSVKITWDSTSEISRDVLERGMDFLGYRLYRARRTDLDTFNVNSMVGDLTHSRGKGPMGWKQIAEWSIPTPFQKSYLRAGNPNIRTNPFIDSLRIIGPYTDASGNIIDSMAIRVMRIPQGMNLYSDEEVFSRLYIDNNFKNDNQYMAAPIIASFDTSFFAQPWGPYIAQFADFRKEVLLQSGGGGPTQYFRFPYINYKVNERSVLMDSILAGVVYIDRALMKFNPLIYERKSINVSDPHFKSLPADGLVYKTINGVLTQTVDTAYVMNTYRSAIINGTRTFIVDAYVPYPKNRWMTDTLQVRSALNDLYELILDKKISNYDFADFANDSTTIYEVIVPYMRQVTNNRTFVDIGDDNRDGIISLDENPAKTEKLINNIPYYYRLLAYDEGDFIQPTNAKSNDGNPGLPNFAEVYPAAPRAERRLNFEVIHVDPSIGGLYNFNFYALEPERAMQLFGGDTLELEFQPVWQERELRFLGRAETDVSKFGLYQRNMKLRNITKDQLLFNGVTYLEVQPGYFESYRGLFTENAFSYVLADSLVLDSISGKQITFGMPFSTEITERTGRFSSGNFKEPGFFYTRAMLPPAYGTLGFDFDFTIQQFGGNFRPDSATLAQAKFADGGTTPTTQAVTPINFKIPTTGTNQDIVMTSQKVDYNIYRKTNDIREFIAQEEYGSFNNGPGHYLVEFLPGGEEDIHVEWGPTTNKQNKVFRAPYLNMRITNKISYERPAPEVGPDAKATVTYPGEIPFMFIDTVPSYNVYSNIYNYPTFGFTKRMYPDPRNLPFHGIHTDEFIGKYNIAAHGWINSRRVSNIQLPNTVARRFDLRNEAEAYVAQGKYYLTAVNGTDTLDFTHLLNISGVQFALDYANRGERWQLKNEWPRVPQAQYVFGPDFKAGDKIMLKTFGGALGYPMPGAKVRVKVSEPMAVGEKYTDKLLDQIQVVPNPYYVSHQGQRSPYDAKLYFTRLPAKCKIDIYTITGDLVISIDHDEFNSPEKDRYALNIWNLLTKNGQRVASQTLAAVISTPDGAQTIKNFSVVVGGFRLLPD